MSLDDERIGRLMEGRPTAEDERAAREHPSAFEALRRETASLLCAERLVRYALYLEREQPDLVVATRRRIECETERASSQFVDAIKDRLSREASPGTKSSRRRLLARTPNGRASRPSRPRINRRWWFAGVLAATLLLATGLYLAMSANKSAPAVWQAKLTTVSGPVRLERGGMAISPSAGANVSPKDVLRTEKQGRATVTFGDGTRIELNEETTIELGAAAPIVRPSLERGAAYVQAAKQAPGSRLILNPERHDQVEIVGTQFEIVVRPGISELKMVEGRVQYGPGEKAIPVAAGQASEVRPGNAPTSPQPCDPLAVALWRSGATRGPPLTAPRSITGKYTSRTSDQFALMWFDFSLDVEGHRLEKAEIPAGVKLDQARDLTFEPLVTLLVRDNEASQPSRPPTELTVRQRAYLFPLPRNPARDTSYRFRIYGFNSKTNQTSPPGEYDVTIHPDGTWTPSQATAPLRKP